MGKEIESLPTESLIPYARNARTHSDAQVAQIAASIREFGFNNPVLIDSDGGIIAGHGRVMAARKLGLEEVPCLRLSHLSENDKRAYILADNKLAENSGWDESMLALELSALQSEDFDLGLIGFDPDELERLLDGDDSPAGTEGLTDPDEVPEALPDPVTQPGDIWLLGEHRLMCGDSTDAGAVAELMQGEKADLCFTSPPYGQQRDYTEEGKAKVADWDGLMQGVFSNLPMSETCQVLVNLGMIHRDGEWIPYWDGWIEWMRGQGWRRFGWYVWDQGSGLPGDWNGRFAPSHEFIFHFTKDPSRPKKIVAKNPNSGPMGSGLRSKDGKNPKPSSICTDKNKISDSVIRVNRNSSHGTGHPATFPVDLASFVLSSWPGSCYEPFSGSGTTLIAAEQTGRRCYAMEISPQYVDVAVRRWQKFTGKQAVLEETGAPFPSE